MKQIKLEDNTKVDQGKSDEMRSQEMAGKAIVTNEQGAKLINPGESALSGEAELVNQRVKKALLTTFRA